MPRSVLTFLLLALALLLPHPVEAKDDKQPLAGTIDLVLALDTSGSMEGLVTSARDKFWAVVTELSRARPEPDLKVGLITYGGVGREDVANVLFRADLTYDFDRVVDAIDTTAIRGGEEFVGGALHTAVTRMTWREGALKVVFVAGNESADQDPAHGFRDVAKRAAAAGIKVNAIYCGGAEDGIASGWRELARLGDGTFAHIDHDHGTVHVASPYDEDLMRLSQRLNGTYRFFGAERKRRAQAQVASDSRAEAAGAPVAAERAAAKASKQYGRVGDLVRAAEAPDFDWDALEEEDLPADLRGLTKAALRAKIDALRAERERLATKIATLTKQRSAYVAKERARLELDDAKALDRVLRDAIREQAHAAGFRFDATR